MIPPTDPQEGPWQGMGRPATFGRNRDRWQREYDARFGRGRWRIVHRYRGESLRPEQVGELVERSYAACFAVHPEYLAWLCETAKEIYENARSNVRSGTDYHIQERKLEHIYDIALRRVLLTLHRPLAGKALLAFCGPGRLDVPINPGRVPFVDPKAILIPAAEGWWKPESIEEFCQTNRWLEVREVAARS